MDTNISMIRYNDVFRYIPLNGDIVGLCAASEYRDAWFSPAGFTRGAVRNVVKLPFNPRQSQRDTLYKKWYQSSSKLYG